jgi:hypothetical protein
MSCKHPQPLHLRHRQLVPVQRLHSALTRILPTLAPSAQAILYSHDSRPTPQPDPAGTHVHFTPNPLLPLLLRTPSPTRRLSRRSRSASLSFRAPSSPAFSVHALTTTTVAERWPFTACAAIASNDCIRLPHTRGAHQLPNNGGAHLRCGYIAAALTRLPTPVPESPAATYLVDS